MMNDTKILPDEMMLKDLISNNIKFLRKKEKPCITQRKLAEKLQITQKSLSNYEKGFRLPSVIVLIGITNYFHIPIEDLLLKLLKERTKV